MLYQSCDNTLRFFLSYFLVGKNTISTPKIVFGRWSREENWGFRLKNCKNWHFGTLLSSPVLWEKILTFQIWLKMFLILPFWSQDAKLAWKYHWGGSKWPNVRFWLNNGHFGPLSESPLMSGIFFWLFKLGLKSL